ncbi:MAG: CDP-alcohol phosphatidyltransferase family protein [Candidatus Thermoplasmatota archaeon]|nr:CDP-alcohol phosphatidyltransferase family protein [Candidatus Thermoplasmatota archaeon]
MIKLLSGADIVTLFNATLGFLALLLVFSHQFSLAASLILLGLLADGLDGMIARRLGTGKIGEYLEPLADMISLSIAPLTLIYVTYYERSVLEPSTHLLFGIVLVFSLICSLIRLSSFSLLKKKRFFVGLPTSASAMFLVVLSYLIVELWYLLAVIVVLSFGMVSSIRFPKLGLKVNLVAAVFILITILFQGRYNNTAPLLLLAALLFYVIVGPIYFQVKHRNSVTEKDETHN